DGCYILYSFFFSSRRRHTRSKRDWSSDVALPIYSIKVSDKEIEENAKKGSHILIKVKSEDSKDGLSDKEAKKKADDLLKKIKDNPDDFDKIAKEETQDEGTKDKNGSLGFVLKGQMDEAFEKSLFKLKDGEISDVVKSQYGYHIIRADKGEASKKQKESLKEQ